MKNVASDLFLLTTNMSQLKSSAQIEKLFIESLQDIFPNYNFQWKSHNLNATEECLPVNTKTKIYGYIQFDKTFTSNSEQLTLVQNAFQLIAIFLERLEQEELLSNSKSEIDKRSKVEEELRQSEEKFKNIFDHAAVGKSITTIDGHMKVNQAFCDILGYSPEKLSTIKWHDITHPDDVEHSERILLSILSGEHEKVSWEKRYIHKNGSIVWVNINTSLQRDKNNKPLYFITTIIDITLQKRMEEELRESNAYLENLFKYANAPIMVWDNCFVITHFNPAFEKLSGFSASEVMGDNIDILFSKETIESSLPLIINTQLGERWESVEIEIKRKDGEPRIVLWNSANIFDNDGEEVIATIAQGYDITERKRTEERLNRSEEKYRMFIDLAADAFFQGDGNGNFIAVNQSAIGLTGFTRKELLKMNIKDLFSTDLLNQKPFRYDLLEQGETIKAERVVVKKDGNRVIIEMNSKKMPDGSYQSFLRDISDRKMNEEVLQQSKKNFQITIDESPMGIRIISKKGETIYANQTLLALFEVCSLDELNETPSSKRYTPESYREHLIRKEKRIANRESDPEYQISIVRKNKKVRHLHVIRKEVLWDEQPQSMVIYQDITSRKEAEVELRDSERLLNESQRVSGIGSYTLNILTGVWDGSAYLNELFGIDASDDHSVEGWIAVIHPDDRNMMANYFANDVIKEKGKFNKEYRIIGINNKQEKWVHGIGELEFDVTGNPVKMIGTIQDVTERKKADEELRKLSRAVEQSPDSIIITNTSGEIEYANPALLNLSGHSSEELIGKKPTIFGSGERSNDEYADLWKTISSGKVWQGEFHNKKKNGELYWESATLSPVLDHNGEITHYLGIQENITEKKKLTLELIEAKERAEESDRLKASFLANMSHEIRTPMNSIMGFASLLPDEESKILMSQYAQIIVQNAEQLVSLIDGIVMYSKLQTGLFIYRPSLFDPYKLLVEIQQSFSLPSNQIAVTIIYDLGLQENTTIYSDYDKLRQIITNLVSNAFKYTLEGEISVGCYQNDNRLEFFVKDTGIGIPSKDIDHVFERFYRGSNINEANTRGTGLGLCIVKELVEMLGGKIWVESEEGKGSKFSFTVS